MTDDLGRGQYDVEVNNAAAIKGAAAAEQALVKAGTSADTSFTKAGGSVNKFAGELKTGALQGVGLAGGLQVANIAADVVRGTVEALGHSLDLASDKAESASKVSVLFGDAQDKIAKASENAATTVGMSSGAYFDAAGTLGNLLKNFDIAGDKAADMSVDMIQLAADMGSFNNADPSEVVQAMGAAFRGETEPIRRFGVMLDAATVAEKAVALGLATSTKEVDKNAKAQATYQLILEQTSAAQGDFARTSDGMANQQRINAAKLEESWTKVGEALMPIAMEVMPILADAVVAVVDAIVPFVTILGDAIGVASDVVGALGDMAGAVFGVGDAYVKGKDPVLDWVKSLEGADEAVDKTARGFDPAMDALNDFSDAWDKASGKTEAETNRITTAVEGMKSGIDWDSMAKSIGDGAKTGLTDPIVGAQKKANKDAAAEARKLPLLIATAMIDQQFHVEDAMDALAQIEKDSIKRGNEIAKIESFLTGKAMHDGLNDADPVVAAAWRGYQQIAKDRLATLKQEAGEEADRTGKKYGANLDNGKGTASASTANLLAPVRAKMVDLKNDAGTYGDRTGDAYASNFAAALRAGLSPVTAAFRAYKSIVIAGSPPKPGAALYGIDKWGWETGKAWVEPFVASLAEAPGQVARVLGDTRRALAIPMGRGAGLDFAPGLSGTGVAGPGGSINHTGEIAITVRDPDGGLARAGIDTHQLSRDLGQEIRLQLIRTPATFSRPAGR